MIAKFHIQRSWCTAYNEIPDLCLSFCKLHNAKMLFLCYCKRYGQNIWAKIKLITPFLSSIASSYNFNDCCGTLIITNDNIKNNQKLCKIQCLRISKKNLMITYTNTKIKSAINHNKIILNPNSSIYLPCIFRSTIPWKFVSL